MDKGEINNPLMGDGEPPIYLPPREAAWDDMRRRLDSEMPLSALPLPGSVINVDDNFLSGITSLFGLLLISTVALFVTGYESGKNNKGDVRSNTLALHTLPRVQLKRNAIAKENYPTLPPGASVVKGQHGDNAGLQQRISAEYAGTKHNNKKIYGGKGRNIAKNRRKGAALTKVSSVAKDRQKQIVSIEDKSKTGLQSTVSTFNNATNDNVSQHKQTQGPVTDATAKQLKKDAIAKRQNGLNNADSAISQQEAKKDDTQWQLGLSWKAQVPLSSTRHYFAGGNGSSQPYRILFPGIWMSIKADKALFEAELNPFASTVYNPKPFLDDVVQGRGQSVITTTQLLNKLFGVSLAARYSYYVRGNWYLGGGLQAVWVQKGVETFNNRVDNNGNTTYYKTFGPMNDTGRANIAKFKIRLDAQLLYMTKQWGGGLRTGVYFTPVVKTVGDVKNPLETELFFRWRLWHNKSK